MTGEIRFNVPAMQLVCHLVALSNITDSVPVLTHSEPLHQANDQLPDDYVAFPDIGIAYKYHYHTRTLLQAMKVCHEERAVLGVIDSSKKVQVVKSLGLPGIGMWAGAIRLDDTNWINVNTESTLSSLLWRPGYPGGARNVACFWPGDPGLTNHVECEGKRPFLCEVPILPSNTTIAAN